MTEISIKHLKYTIGEWVENHEGITLGKLEDIKFNPKRSMPTYVILYCDELFGITDRYFAIPAIPSLIQTSIQGRITIRVDKKVLQIVMGINAQEDPQWESKMSASIFELYEYQNTKLSS
jgi:hypothetical protein